MVWLLHRNNPKWSLIKTSNICLKLYAIIGVVKYPLKAKSQGILPYLLEFVICMYDPSEMQIPQNKSITQKIEQK